MLKLLSLPQYYEEKEEEKEQTEKEEEKQKERRRKRRREVELVSRILKKRSKRITLLYVTVS